MTKSFGIGLLAVATTASMGLANGGEGEKKSNSDGTLYQSGPVTMKAGSGITFDAGDEFKLTLKNQMQFQWTYRANDNARNNNSFLARRLRTGLGGHVFNKNINYLLKMDWVDAGPSVKDAWVHWNFMNNESGTIGLRLGQGKTYFGLEGTGSSAGLDFVERNVATKAFSDARTQGAWLHGSYSENSLRWNLGVQNGDVSGDAFGIFETGEETPNVDNELSYVLNISWDPNGDFMGGKTNESFKQSDPDHTQELKGTVGAGVYIGNGRDFPGNATDIDTMSWNLNTAWKSKGWFGMGEFFWREDSPDVTGGIDEDGTGWAIGGSYTLPKSGNSDLQWGFAARYAMVSLDTDTGNTINFLSGTPLGGNSGDVSEFTLGVNAFYKGHNCKTQVNWTLQNVDPDGAATDLDNHLIEVQFTLIF